MGNSASDRPAPGGAADQADGALLAAFQLMAEALTRVQEAMLAKEERAKEAMEETLRLHEERARERVEEAKRETEQRMQEKIDDVIRSLEGKMEENAQRMEAKVEELEVKLTSEIETGKEASRRTEERVKILEESAQRALVSVFPKVEALLKQLER